MRVTLERLRMATRLDIPETNAAIFATTYQLLRGSTSVDMPDPVGIPTEDFCQDTSGEFPEINGLIGSSTGQKFPGAIDRQCAYPTAMTLKHFKAGPTPQIPQTQVRVLTATDQGLTIRGKCQRPNSAEMSL
jgi:hypothetical protein